MGAGNDFPVHAKSPVLKALSGFPEVLQLVFEYYAEMYPGDVPRCILSGFLRKVSNR